MSHDNDIERKFIYRYPWLPGSRKIFEPDESEDKNLDKRELDPVEYFKKIFGSYFEKYNDLQVRLKTIFIYALEKREEGIVLKDEDQFNIILYSLDILGKFHFYPLIEAK